MNTDKTLADVQPGGRVRLGDQPPFVFARFVNGVRMAEGVTIEKERNLTDAMQVAAKVASKGPNGETPVLVHVAALSSQPSPGGQDALDCIGRIEEAIEFRVPHDIYAAVHGELTELKAALAALQPVGEPVAEIFAAFRPDGSLAGTAFTAEAAGYWSGCKVVRYTAPPAQAVDLDAARALLQRRIEQWRSHLPADPGAPGTREIETKGEHDYNNDVAIYRQGIAVMEEVLFKIDSQAVGNG